MTDHGEDRFTQLYRSVIDELPGGRPDPVAARSAAGVQRRNRRLTAAGLVVAAVATVVLVVNPTVFRGGDVTAVPAAGGTPAVCPALRPGTDNAAADYADAFYWDGRTYLSGDMFSIGPKHYEPGTQVATVTCSIRDLTAVNRNLVADLPWPDGTATYLATGTPVFAVDGTTTSCALAVKDTAAANKIEVFVAVDEPSWRLSC